MDLRAQLQHTLGSSYTVERELGGGGMARVFVANDTRLRRNVVVKLLSPELAAGLSAERFEREIQLAASLQQANIVPVLSAGEMDGLPYYTMPYVDGESLRTLLTTRGTPPIAEAVGILHDVARALSYAHARGVVHRDIKPDNVLLSHGAAVVTDFGIAKAISVSRTAAREVRGDATLTQAGTAIGTPAYMAPEQAAGDPHVDARADIYAFGCMAYEVLTGHPPFSGASLQELIAAHLTETPKPVQALRPDTPASLAALVTRCLGKRAIDRPANVDELLQTLATLATPQVADTKRQRLTHGRNRRVLAIVAAVGLVLIGGSVVRWLGHTQPGSRALPLDRSIAVLPFMSLSDDKKDEYIGEGLAEDISNALVKAGLRVVPASARRLTAHDKQGIAKELGVANVLGGTVRRDGERLRTTVNLIAASDGSVIWSDEYDRDFKDAFAVQDEIAHRVAAQLRVALAGGATATLARKETDDPEALALYWQGIWQWNRRTASALQRAISLFEQAVHRDSSFARAYAGIGMAYAVLPVYADVSADEMAERALDAGQRALTKDGTLVEAHYLLGYAHAMLFENAAAESSFARALDLDSSSATAHFWHSLLLAHVGNAEEAMRESQRARFHDPASLVIQHNVAQRFFDKHLYVAADSGERGVLALDSTFHIASLTLGAILTEEGKFDEAIATLEALTRQPNLRSSEKLGVLAYAYARAGRAPQARATLARLPRDTLLSISASVAAALFALGERDSAVSVFRRAVAIHDPWLLATARFPRFDALRKEHRLTALFTRIEAPK
jgi:serine/threonine-protein kinase